MSGHPILAGQGQRIHAPAVERPQGLARDLPILLFADAFILVTAVVLWNLNGGLAQTMTWLAVVSSLSLAMLSWFAARHWADLKCQAFVIQQAAWAYWYLIPMLLIGLKGRVYLDDLEREFTPHQIAKACAAVLLVKFVSALGYQLVVARPVLNIERITKRLNARSFSVPIWAVAVQLGLGLAPFIFSGKSVWVAILGSRSKDGVFPTTNFAGSGAAWFGFTYFLTACCLLGLYQFLVSGRQYLKLTYVLLGLAALGVSVFAVSTRTMVLASVMPALTFYLLGSPDRLRPGKVLVCLLGLWLGADLLVSSRDKGFLQNGLGSERVSRNLVDNNFFGELLFVVGVVPDQVHYDYLDPVAYAAMTFIPRSLWTNKPVPETAGTVVRMRANVLSGDLSGNMLPGIVGQYWEFAGWLGLVVLGAWLSVTCALSDVIIMSSNWSVRYLVFTFIWALFISFRAFALGTVMPAIFCGAAILFFSRPKVGENG